MAVPSDCRRSALAMGVLLSAALMIVVYGQVILLQVLNASSALFVLKIAQWPAAAFLLILALLGLYRFAPAHSAAEIEMAASWERLRGSYVDGRLNCVQSVRPSLQSFWAALRFRGTLVILMFWFYLSGVVILAGGEINAILEDAAAQRKIPGAKRRGQR